MAKRALVVGAVVFAAAGMTIAESGMKSVQAGEVRVSNPYIAPASGMEAGRKVTWDCVWFGNYPQAEIVSSSQGYTALDASLRQEGDVIVSDSVYTALKNSSEWNSENELALDGVKYRRMKAEDATHVNDSYNDRKSYYQWADRTSWHYFKYEPIKWRVLHTDGNQALLLADAALDDQQFHIVGEDVTWESSTIRSWLNGYGPDSNQQSVDCSRVSFMNMAFNDAEKTAIVNASGENITGDKVFLLSKSEVSGTDTALSYGFVNDSGVRDEARKCKSSAYAKAMGAWHNTQDYAGNCMWWLRSPGFYDYYALYVDYDGWVNRDGSYVNDDNCGVRPALNLNLSSLNPDAYAGTVCSNGTVHEEGKELLISFDAAGGTCSAAGKNAVYGGFYGNLPVPARTGYSFAGWYVSGGTQVTDGTEIALSAHHTLSARWTAHSCEVRFDANGGSCGTPSKTAVYGSGYGTLPTPKRMGYAFVGWYTSAEGGSRVTAGTRVNQEQSHTLYAHWTKTGTSGTVVIPGTNPGASQYLPVSDATARKNNEKYVFSDHGWLESATGVTEADKYLSLGKIKIGKTKFTLHLNQNGVQNLSYKSSKKKVATVSQSGVVKMRSVGDTTITVTASISGTGQKITKKYLLQVYPDAPSLKSLKSTGAGNIKISWSKSKRAKGYRICYSTSSNFKSGTKVFAVPSRYRMIRIRNLKRGRKYYVRVYSYAGNRTSAWSKTKTVKVR